MPDTISRDSRSAIAGLVYFAIVFAAGFLFGVLRTLFLISWTSEAVAVLIELPVILAISWAACRWLVARFNVAARPAPRLIMGGAAFLLLMLAEFILSFLVFGRSPAEHVAKYCELPAILGLAGQIAFAVFPIVQIRKDRRRS